MSIAPEWPRWIGVVCDDLESQLRFYRDVVGFRVTKRGSTWIHFEMPGGNLFELIQRSSRPQYEYRRFQVGFTVRDIEGARAELIASGVEPISELEGGADDGGRWCYFRDPEGNVFELKEH